jgi:hypothetical protein
LSSFCLYFTAKLFTDIFLRFLELLNNKNTVVVPLPSRTQHSMHWFIRYSLCFSMSY